jgi:excisionase family DNA binding protein
MPAAATPEPPPDVHRNHYTPAEAAAALGLSRQWVAHKAAARQIPHYRYGNKFLFSAEHIAEIKQMAEVRPQPLPAARARRRRAG